MASMAQNPGGAPQLNLGGVIPLSAFRVVKSGLTRGEMELTVNQALLLIDDLYAHLLLKQKMHAVDPVQALKLVLMGVRSGEFDDDEGRFHCVMLEVFNSVRDLHTNYLLPEPYASAVAFLPFIVGDYFDGVGIRHFPVTNIIPAAVQAPFGKGVEITHWNGIPMEEAVRLNGADHAGSNPAARYLQGLLTMTSRPLMSSLPPREEWVTLTYLHPQGASEIRFAWSVFRPSAPPNSVAAGDPAHPAATAVGIDIGLAAAHRARQILFKPESAFREPLCAGPPTVSGAAPGSDALANSTAFPNELEYGVRDSASGPVGFLRIRSFDVQDPMAFMNEVIRILSLLPADGLILDVRANPGGNILAGEHLLQLFTDRTIEPAPVCFRSTTGTVAFLASDFLKQWKPSVELAPRTGENYSQYFPLSDPHSVNSVGRKYPGPVVLLTDAACYSTTDFFSAGFQDHEIGPIIGVDAATGAGGANVWSHEVLRQFYPGPKRSSPLQQLPRGMSMRIAFRRSIRVGSRFGIPVEDLGVACDLLHQRTRRDVFEDSADLYAKAALVLRKGLAAPGTPAAP